MTRSYRIPDCLSPDGGTSIQRSESSSQRLILVDSPAKAATLRPALEPGDELVAAVGPWRVLPPDFVADPESDFEPLWELTPSARRQLKELREAAAGKEWIVVVTDPGRGGAGSAWHLRELLGEEYRDRVRHVPLPVVSARCLIAGLARASSPGVSSMDGSTFRVLETQSIAHSLLAHALQPLIGPNQGLSWDSLFALSLLSARERAIDRFEPEPGFVLQALLECEAGRFSAGHDSDPGPSALDEQAAAEVCRRVASSNWVVSRVTKRRRTKRPDPAFTTASLFRTAFERLRFTADRTRAIAHRLYEGKSLGEAPASGLITYWVSDSSRVSAAASAAARTYLERVHGPQSVPARPSAGVGPRGEAVRPTLPDRDAGSVADHLVQDEAALYELIWQRFIESHAKPEVVREVSVELLAGRDRLLGSGPVVLSPGFRLTPRAAERAPLPVLRPGQSVLLIRVEPVPVSPDPPQRYDDVTLLEDLLERGLSHSAQLCAQLGELIASLEENDLAVRSGLALHPTRRGLRAQESLADRLPGLLDATVMGEQARALTALESRPSRRRLALRPLRKALAGVGERRTASRGDSERDRRPGIRCPDCGKGVVVERPGRDGRPFHACDAYPRCRFRSAYPPVSGPCPACGRPVLFEKPTPGGGQVVFCSDRSCGHSRPA